MMRFLVHLSVLGVLTLGFSLGYITLLDLAAFGVGAFAALVWFHMRGL